ncbi:MAG: GTP pyrophosphokinase [Patescibacteria group bacterium]
MSTLDKAIVLAKKLHEGQTDLGGNPYIHHVLWVMNHVEGTSTKICAVLHDVIEDTQITPQNLLDAGFSLEIIHALGLLTKAEAESRISYILKIAFGPKMALNVKIADLTHNIDITRIPKPEKWHLKRIAMYKREKFFLTTMRTLRLGF